MNVIEIFESTITEHNDLAAKILPRFRLPQSSKVKYKGSMSNEEYDIRLNEVNPNILRIGEFIAQQKPLLHRCLICGNLWEARPVNLLRGRGCPDCAKIQRAKSRTKTPKQYEEYLLEINDSIIAIEDYIKWNTPINHKCLVCGCTWKMAPNNARKQGCPDCTMKALKDRMTKTTEEYIQELSVANPNLVCLDEYVGAHIKLRHRYKDCGHIATITPSAALMGAGCKICSDINAGLNRRKTTKQFIDELKIANPSIKVLGEYVTAFTPIDLLCLVCGYQWSPMASSVIGKNTSGCPKCGLVKLSNALSFTIDIYKQRAYEVNPNVEILSNEYYNNNTPLEHKCKICGYIWLCNPSNILAGHGCPNCAGNVKYTLEDVRSIISGINPLIEVIGPYISANKPLRCKCLVCNNLWDTSLSDIKHDRGCPICASSKGEKVIKRILDDYNVNYIQQYKYDGLVGIGGRRLSYDFYLPNYNLLLEFQGKQHEQPIELFGGEEQFKIQQEHDKRKREYAINHNIDLLEIWYYDYDKIEEILINYLNLVTLETVIPA